MLTFKIPLPSKLHSKRGIQPKVEFNMSRRHIWINDEEYPNHLSSHLSVSFKGYLSHVLSDHVLVTLMYDTDIFSLS